MKQQRNERRREARIPGKVRVFVSNDAWEGLNPLFTLNVSNSGAYILGPPTVPALAGSSVLVKAGTELLVGMVAHTLPPADPTVRGHGFGVSFFDQHPNWWNVPGAGPSVTPPRASPLSHEETPESLYLAGTGYLDQKNYVMARQKFEQAYRMTPDPRYLAMQSVCTGYQYLSTAFWSKAEESFVKAMGITSACSHAMLGLEELSKRTRSARSIR